jgi:cyclophilin family peptidyl-prolyl cis-trans isomerase
LQAPNTLKIWGLVSQADLDQLRPACFAVGFNMVPERMKPDSMIRRLPAVLALLAAGLCCARPSPATIVRFNTSAGDIDVRLYDPVTPISVANFLSYVTTNRYHGTFIHRVPQRPASQGGGTANFVVQGGGFRLNNSIFAAAQIALDPPIGNEPMFSNTRGTLAFAKNAQGATSQWFFNLKDNSFLDSDDFTVFGRVLGDGMNVVDAINNLPTVNASAAHNAQGEDFDEVPVFDRQKVLDQNDIHNADAVMINSVVIRGLHSADYNRNSVVDMLDYQLWKSTIGSTTDASADGNGNGVVDAGDYTIWRNAINLLGGQGAAAVVPEPAGSVLILSAGAALLLARPRRSPCAAAPLR